MNLSKTLLSAVLSVVSIVTAFSAFGKIEIRSDYPGGNVKVRGIDEAAGVVKISPDLRDTKGRWFHFDFILRGAAGRTLHFQFPNDKAAYLATLGPAISSDGGTTWRWLRPDGTRHEPRNAFDYTFGKDENETRFAVSIPYVQKNWDAAAARWREKDGVKFDVLCKSQSGTRDTELLRIPCRKGDAKWIFAFTARHHACETTANAVMEGVIDEILAGSKEGEWIRDNADCVFVPFMDKDGVECCDQGKNRRPHDHNRDYTAGIYTSVRAFKELLTKESSGKQIVFFDLHSPYIRSKGKSQSSSDSAFTFATPVPARVRRIETFRRLWTEEQKGKSLVYDGGYDENGSKWQNARLDKARQTGLQNSRGWVEGLPNCWLSICGEFGYSLCGGVFSQDGGRELGRGLLKAAVRTVKELASGACGVAADAETNRPSIVFASIAEADKYIGMHPRFAQAFAVMRRADLAELKPGTRIEIDGSNCWAFVQESNLKPVADQNTYEAHGAFIDIQVPISDPETYGTMKTPDDARAKFDVAKDIVLFQAKGETRTLRPGEFAIFFPPYGAHAPGLSENGPRSIRKLVIKVRD